MWILNVSIITTFSVVNTWTESGGYASKSTPCKNAQVHFLLDKTMHGVSDPTPLSPRRLLSNQGTLTLVSGHSQRSWSAGSCCPFQQDGSALASYQFFQEFRLSSSIMNLGHCLCAKPELSRWIFGAGRSTWGDKPVLGSVSVLGVEALALPDAQGVSGFIQLIHPLSVSDFLRVFWNEISQPAFGIKCKHKNPYISLKAIFTY